MSEIEYCYVITSSDGPYTYVQGIYKSIKSAVFDVEKLITQKVLNINDE